MLFLALLCALQSAGPAEEAYAALRARDYDRAIVLFQRAVEAAPSQPGLRKDLAYTYLKAGEPEGARDQFAEAMRLDASDARVALEYAFLCYETRRPAEARRLFGRLRAAKDAAVRATAVQAFDNIDRPLAEGIARWSAVVARLPQDFSAHLELARLAERRDELSLAADNYFKAWRLRPAERSLLLDLARVWKARGNEQQAVAALLAASRGSPPRVAEEARELLGQHQPSPAELRRAAELDPANTALARVPTSQQPDAREMAERSYRLGYLRDAVRYFETAYEADPLDFAVMLKLGWSFNLLRQDELALRWFSLARRSPDPAIAAEAAKAMRGLRPAIARLRTTVWLFPFFSSRWNDVFSYAQAKTELRLGRLPLRPYLSLRFVGDTRRTTGEALPAYLSESALILGAGLALQAWHGVALWAEAGGAASYLTRRDRGRLLADYRGGLAWSRGIGHLLGAESPGWFADTSNDAVFVSRFANDCLLYSQNRSGYTLPGAFRAQLYANLNFTADTRREYWANFVEWGPGMRFRWQALPESLVFSVNLLRGAYTRNDGNPRRPNYFDLRAGFWYAVTR